MKKLIVLWCFFVFSVCYPSTLLKDGVLIIDDFEYSSDVEANEAWKGTGKVKINKENKTEGNTSMVLPLSFKNRGDRCLWDRYFSTPIDLSPYKFFYFDIFIPDNSGIMSPNIYFGYKTDDGKIGWFCIWYKIEKSGWNRIVLNKDNAELHIGATVLSAKDKIDEWKKISIIRISFWGGKPDQAVYSEVLIDNLRASVEPLKIFNLEKNENFYSTSDIKIIPVPKKIELKKEKFYLKEDVNIYLTDDDASKRVISVVEDEFKGEFNINLNKNFVYNLNGFKVAVIGNRLNNEGIKRMIKDMEFKEEGYFIDVFNDSVIILSKDEKGFFYGFQTLKQMINSEKDKYFIEGAKIYDYPYFKMRGIFLGRLDKKRYDPDLSFHKKIIKLCSSLKINYLFIEIASDMEYKRHDFPETGKDAYSKEEIKGLVDYARRYYVEIVPYYHFFSHVAWLRAEPKYRELLEKDVGGWSVNWCPSNPEVYKFAKDIIDEAIDVFSPKFFHIGHDEIVFAPLQICNKCREKTKEELILTSIKELSEYIIKKGVKPVVWADNLYSKKISRAASEFRIDGDKIIEKLPKEVILNNWNYGTDENGIKGELEYLKSFGNKVIQSPFYNDRNIVISARLCKEIDCYGLLGTFWFEARNSMAQYNMWADSVWNVIIMDANYFWNPDCNIYLLNYDWAYKCAINFDIKKRIPPLKTKLNFLPVDIYRYTNYNLENGLFEETKEIKLPEKIYVDDIPFITGKKVVIPDKEKIEININQKCKYLYFLHTSNLPLSLPNYYHWTVCHLKPVIGNYKLFYEDGSFIEIPLKARVNIGHFNSKYGIIDARIGYQTEDKEKNMFRIYLYQFENPYPEKEIKKIEFYKVENSEKMIPVLFALTIGK